MFVEQDFSITNCCGREKSNGNLLQDVAHNCRAAGQDAFIRVLINKSF